MRAFGEFLRHRVRGEDVACRLGEEFAVLLPDAALYRSKSDGRDRVTVAMA